MKKFILSVLSLLLFVTCFAQTADNRKPASLGVSFFLNDFTTAADIKKNGLGNVIRNKSLFKTGKMNAGLGLTYLQGLTNQIDFTATLGGSFVNYPLPNQLSSSKKFLLEATANVNVKLLSDQFWVVPFADLGVGASKYASNYAAFMPLGAGLQINLNDQAFILLNSQYRIPITESAAAHLYHSITLAGVIGKKKL